MRMVTDVTPVQDANVALLRPYLNHDVGVSWVAVGGETNWARGKLMVADAEWWVLKMPAKRVALSTIAARMLIIPADQKVTALVVYDEAPPG